MNNKIQYEIKKDVGFGTGEAFGDVIEIVFSKDDTGLLEVGRKTFPLKNGVAKVKTRDFADGLLPVSLIKEKTTVRCDALLKEGEKITVAPLSDAEIRALRERVYLLGDAVEELSEKVLKLTKSVFCETLF